MTAKNRSQRATTTSSDAVRNTSVCSRSQPADTDSMAVRSLTGRHGYVRKTVANSGASQVPQPLRHAEREPEFEPAGVELRLKLDEEQDRRYSVLNLIRSVGAPARVLVERCLQ